MRTVLTLCAAATAAAMMLLTAVGCANDQRVATTPGHVRLSGDREPFTFSSWDVGRVEWSAPANEPNAVPPDVSAVLADKTVVPLRGLTLAKAKATPGLTVGPAAKADDGQGNVWPSATPATGSGFHFDFVGDRLVHFVAAPVNNPDGSTTQPVMENHAAADLDANGDVRLYTLPLDHDSCIRLFGGAQGLETQFSLPPVLP